VADVQGKGEAKKKEHREVGEGYDAVIIEDNSDDEADETLQLRFRGGGWNAKYSGHHREAS
jgi:hypothetical protein